MLKFTNEALPPRNRECPFGQIDRNDISPDNASPDVERLISTGLARHVAGLRKAADSRRRQGVGHHSGSTLGTITKWNRRKSSRPSHSKSFWSVHYATDATPVAKGPQPTFSSHQTHAIPAIRSPVTPSEWGPRSCASNRATRSSDRGSQVASIDHC